MNEILSKGDRVRVVTGCHKDNDGDKWIDEPIWETGTVKGYWAPGITIINLDSGGTKWLKDSEEWEKLPISRKIATHETSAIKKPHHYVFEDGTEAIKIINMLVKRYKQSTVAAQIYNTIKYIIRAPFKNGVEDLKKAKESINFAIKFWDDKEMGYKK